MSELTAKFVRKALVCGRIWDLGNEVLYKLCADHPDHTADNVIVAKTWLIGRVYAAALERRRVIGNFAGDAFYEQGVAPKIRESDIDLWLQELREEVGQDGQLAVKIHKKMTDLLSDITGLNKRSFASKYLHFHFPDKFFIYDSRADKSAKEIVKLGPRHKRHEKITDVDPQYATFVTRCEQLRGSIGVLIGREPNPRELDKVLLAWSREKPSRA
jgi:hypothetical protein